MYRRKPRMMVWFEIANQTDLTYKVHILSNMRWGDVRIWLENDILKRKGMG